MSISLFFCDSINLSSKRPNGRNTIHEMDRLGHLQEWMEAPSPIQGSSLGPGCLLAQCCEARQEEAAVTGTWSSLG